jgi:hypothetical protein
LPIKTGGNFYLHKDFKIVTLEKRSLSKKRRVMMPRHQCAFSHKCSPNDKSKQHFPEEDMKKSTYQNKGGKQH